MRIEETFSAKVENIEPMVQRVTDLARELHCDEGKDMEIGLALQEALANAIVHGCQSDPSKTVTCRVEFPQPAEMLIVVRDSGPGFEPKEVPDPLSPAGLESNHGRGIQLIRGLMDEAHYERGGTELHMTVALQGGQPR
ncbi:MAG: ATP-binding protein [Acidobacteriota bacterium]|nr:ATP-binding protein [Acidobacteriota bacterium]